MDNPQDWKSAVDPSTGRTYWYHRKTRESTWSKPDVLKETEARVATSSTVTPAIQQQHTIKANAAGPSKSIKGFEESGYRFYPLFTGNDHSLLTKIFHSLHQQKTLDDLFSRVDISLVTDLIEFLFKSPDHLNNTLALQCLWKLSSEEKLLQHSTFSSPSSPSSPAPVWFHLPAYLSKCSSTNSFSILLLSLIVCNLSRHEETALLMTQDFIVPFYAAQMHSLQVITSNGAKQLSAKAFTVEEAAVALDEATLARLFVLVRRGHVLPAVTLLAIILQSIRVEKFVAVLVTQDALPYLHMICLNKTFPEEVSSLATSCLKLLVSSSTYLRDRVIEGYLGLASDTNTFPTPIVHPSNQQPLHPDHDEEDGDLLRRLDKNQRQGEYNFLSDHLTAIEDSESNSAWHAMKRDIEWIPTSGTSWRLPSALLWARCPALRDLIQDFWAHGGESLELSIDATEEVVANVCHFIHSGLVVLPTSFANQCEMLRVSTQLQMVGMQVQLETSMMAKISLDDTIILLEFCEHFQYIALAERCIAMIEQAHEQGGAVTAGLGIDIGYQNANEGQGKRVTDDVNASLKSAIAESLQDVNELLKSSIPSVPSNSSSSTPISSSSAVSSHSQPRQKDSQLQTTSARLAVQQATAAASVSEDEDQYSNQSQQAGTMHSMNQTKLKSGGIYTLLLKQNQPEGGSAGSAAIDLGHDDHLFEEPIAKKSQQPGSGSARKPSIPGAAPNTGKKAVALTTPSGAVLREYQRDMSLQPPRPKTEAEKRWDDMSKPRHVRKPVTKEKPDKETGKHEKEGKEEGGGEEEDDCDVIVPVSSSSAVASHPNSTSTTAAIASNGTNKVRSNSNTSNNNSTASNNNATPGRRKPSTNLISGSSSAASTANNAMKNASNVSNTLSTTSSSLKSTQSLETPFDPPHNANPHPNPNDAHYDSNEEDNFHDNYANNNKTRNDATSNNDNSAVRSSLALLKTKRSLGTTSRLATLNQKLATGTLLSSTTGSNNSDNSSGTAGRGVGGNIRSNVNAVRQSKDSQYSDSYEEHNGDENDDQDDSEQLYRHHMPTSSNTNRQSVGASHNQNQFNSRNDNINSASARNHGSSSQHPNKAFSSGQYDENEKETNGYEDAGNSSRYEEESQDYDEGVAYDANSSQSLLPCPDCQRCFAPESLQKHVKICKKVFASRRRVFDSSKKRVEGIPELQTILEQQKKSKGRNAKAEAAKAEKASKWKEQSSQFREAMRAAREYAQAKESGNLQAYLKDNQPNTKEPYVDPSLKQCPNCLRRFNEKAAERHFPICKDIRAQPTMLKKGTGGSATTMTMKPRR